MKIHIIYTVAFLPSLLPTGVQPTLGPARRPWERSNALAQETEGNWLVCVCVCVCVSGVCVCVTCREGRLSRQWRRRKN